MLMIQVFKVYSKILKINIDIEDLLISKNMFGYKTVLSYLETTENGVKNPKSKYSAVGINIGEVVRL